MARLKHTKHELKAQRDALQRFERFLPTLQLKERQLQAEVRRTEAKLRMKCEEIQRFEQTLDPWIALFDTDDSFETYLRLKSVRLRERNIAGVDIPAIGDISFEESPPDLHATPSWVDEGIRALKEGIRHRLEVSVIRRRLSLLAEELRVTSQRVNLFEKVKIPECRENIRVIRIFLGDEQTAQIVRSKMAKHKGEHEEAAA